MTCNIFTASTEFFYNRRLGSDFVSPEGVPNARNVIFSSKSIWKLLSSEPVFSSVFGWLISHRLDEVLLQNQSMSTTVSLFVFHTTILFLGRSEDKAVYTSSR